MARSPLYTVQSESSRYEVYIRATDQHVATLYYQRDRRTIRFRLDNYSHRMSAMFTSEKSALAAIEREVL